LEVLNEGTGEAPIDQIDGDETDPGNDK